MASTHTALTIAGHDPSSGAGVTADLMVFAAHGLFGTSCITALTIQSTLGVRSIHPILPNVLRQTLDFLITDLPPSGIKIGMMADGPTVSVVIEFLRKLRRCQPHLPVVLDPVLRSSSGRELLTPEGIALLGTNLLPLIDWITPNLDELAILTGLPIRIAEDLSIAAAGLQQKWPHLNVLATGGHLNPPDDLLLTPDGQATWLPGERIATQSTHGTGCALSSALLTHLIAGKSPHAAALEAKNYVAQAMRSATARGGGKGPLNHLWPLLPKHLQ